MHRQMDERKHDGQQVVTSARWPMASGAKNETRVENNVQKRRTS